MRSGLIQNTQGFWKKSSKATYAKKTILPFGAQLDLVEI
jgi:hypothetical protein